MGGGPDLAGLYVFRAKRAVGAVGELVVPFAVARKPGGWQISKITPDGMAAAPESAGQLATIKAAVEAAGGCCTFKTSFWYKEISRVFLWGEQWVTCPDRKKSAKKRKAEPVELHSSAIASLTHFLERNPSYAGLVQKDWGEPVMTGRPSKSMRAALKLSLARIGFYVMSCGARGRGVVDAPLISHLAEDGNLLLEGITRSGALLPANGGSKMGMLRATAEAWSCIVGNAEYHNNWRRHVRKVELLGGVWRFILKGGQPGDRVQAAAAQALTRFVAQHHWAADLARPPAQRGRQSQAVAAAEQPAASAEASEDPGSGSSCPASPLAAQEEQTAAQVAGASNAGAAVEAVASLPAAQRAQPLAAGPPSRAAEADAAMWAGEAAWDWDGSGGAEGASPAAPEAERFSGEQAARPAQQPLQADELGDPSGFAAEAQRLREGNQALAAENDALRRSIIKLVDMRARQAHLKARAKELKRQLKSLKRQEQRVRRALRM